MTAPVERCGVETTITLAFGDEGHVRATLACGYAPDHRWRRHAAPLGDGVFMWRAAEPAPQVSGERP